MNEAVDIKVSACAELPATAYPHHRRVLGPATDAMPTGLLFDSQTFAVMAIAHPPSTQTPDVMADRDGDRILIVTAGDLALQIGNARYRLTPGDAVRIPRGTQFGNTRSTAGVQLVLIRSKPPRSFSIIR